MTAPTDLDATRFDAHYTAMRAGLVALIDERIGLALADERSKSLDLYNQGVNGLPQKPVTPAGGVDATSAGRGVGLATDGRDSVGELTHDFAPSVGPEASVGRSPAVAGETAAAGDQHSDGAR